MPNATAPINSNSLLIANTPYNAMPDWDDIIDIPLSKRRKRLDVELMEISISCLFEACAHYKINVDKSSDDFPLWVSKVYEGAVMMNLSSPTQIRDLALLVVKPAPKSKKR